MKNVHRVPRAASRGGLLIEACVVALLISVLCSLAVPSFSDAIERRRLESVAHELRADLAYAQTAATTQGGTVRLDLRQSAAGSCYVIHRGGSCRCNEHGRARCEGDGEALKTVLLPTSQRVTVSANVAVMSFDGTRRTVTPTATLSVAAPHAGALRIVVNVLGRSRVCSAGFASSGYRPC